MKGIVKILCLLFLLFNCGSLNNDFQAKTGINKSFEFIDKDFKKPNSVLFYMKGYSEFESLYKSLAYEITKRTDKPSFFSNFIIDTDSGYPLGINDFEDIETDANKLEYDLKTFENVCYIQLGNEKSFRENIENQDERRFYFTMYVILQELKTNKIVLKNKFNITAKSNMLTQNPALGETIVKELQF
jgi:hypothetical protein